MLSCKRSVAFTVNVDPEKVAFTSDLKKLAEEIPSSVSAFNPEPAPSTVFSNVNISLAV